MGYASVRKRVSRGKMCCSRLDRGAGLRRERCVALAVEPSRRWSYENAVLELAEAVAPQKGAFDHTDEIKSNLVTRDTFALKGRGE